MAIGLNHSLGSHFLTTPPFKPGRNALNLELIRDKFVQLIKQWFGLSSENGRYVAAVVSVILIIVIAAVIARMIRQLIVWLVPTVVSRFRSKTPREWESALAMRLFFNRGAHVFAALIFYWLIPIALADFPDAILTAKNLTEGYLVIVSVLAINSLLGAIGDVWNNTDVEIGVPIRFATQSVQILTWFVGSLLAVSVTFDLSPNGLYTGLAGAAAILALVFRDSILGFVAGIQLACNDMLRIGDWIDVPQQSASGTVEEISLTTVKIRNFDKTISTVPSYSLVSQSFKNWRGIKETNARRIKRSLNLDMDTVRLMTEQELTTSKSVHLLEDFWKDREQRAVSSSAGAPDSRAPIKNLTNLNLLGDYLTFYLKRHPDICQEKIIMVRQLQPNSQGLPVEIYCFCSDIHWKHYESVQWDVMNQFLAVLPCFDLKVYQLPTSLESGNVPG